jgi:arylsulfatase A-like enzyme
VLDTLDRTGQSENTLVIFTSDNGGVTGYEANNGPWRSGKQHMYEGGLRVPFVARWPARIEAGSSSQSVGISMDIFPTVLEVAAQEVPSEIDGTSLLAALRGKEGPPDDRELYFVRREGGAAYGGKTIEALRRGRWKLVQNSPFAPLELFNLADDPSESVNRSADEPKIFQELSAALRRHIQRGGEVPWQKLP